MNAECKLIDDFLAGELIPKVEAEFLEHLATCTACQREVEIEQFLDHSIQQAWDKVVAPEPVHDTLPILLTPQQSKRWNSRAVFGLIAIASTILIVISISVWSTKPKGQELTDTNGAARVPADSIAMAEDSSEKKSLVTVMPLSDSASILAPQPQPNPDFTFLRAYSAVTIKPISSTLPEN